MQDSRFRVQLWAILALGAVVSGVLAALTRGDPFDMESYRLVRDALNHGALGVYSDFAHRNIIRWPYAPAYFPWIWAAGRIAAHHGPSFEFMLRVPVILADAAIAWIVQDWLGRTGRSQGVRLLAAALVSVGPSFVAIAGYHGQFDAVAILPGVIAVRLWAAERSPQRALLAGVLIGLGGALKTVPLLLVLAVLPSVRTPREALLLIGGAAAPVLLSFLPYALAGSLPAAHVLTYRGLPGVGSVSLLAQPNLAEADVGVGGTGFSALTLFLFRHGSFLVILGLLLVAVVGLRSRAPAPQMAALLWLAVYTFGVNFFFQYLVWGLPFLLMAGYVRAVLVAQVVLIVPTLLFYLRPWHQSSLAVVYAVLMIGLWVAAAWGCLGLGWQLVQQPRWRMSTGSLEPAG